MTGWRKRQVIDMAREAGLRDCTCDGTKGCLERFAELVRADEAERIKQANAPEIERINSHIKSLEDAVLAERERVLKILDDQGTWAHTGDLVELVKENT